MEAWGRCPAQHDVSLAKIDRQRGVSDEGTEIARHDSVDLNLGKSCAENCQVIEHPIPGSVDRLGKFRADLNCASVARITEGGCYRIGCYPSLCSLISIAIDGEIRPVVNHCPMDPRVQNRRDGRVCCPTDLPGGSVPTPGVNLRVTRSSRFQLDCVTP